jgi:tetratricopeptide (TPR) repeat protein
MKRFAEMTAEDIHELYQVLRRDPRLFLQLAQEYIQRYPGDPSGYGTRADAWCVLGHLDRALEDVNTSLGLKANPWAFDSRAEIYRQLGRYQEAIEDYNRFEAMAPEEWRGSFAPLYRADCHACLGNEAAALADCELLPDDHWTPGMHDTPAGNKEAVIAEIKRRARAARTQPS